MCSRLPPYLSGYCHRYGNLCRWLTHLRQPRRQGQPGPQDPPDPQGQPGQPVPPDPLLQPRLQGQSLERRLPG